MTKLMPPPQISCTFDTEEREWCMEKDTPKGSLFVFFEIDIHFHEWRPGNHDRPDETIFEFTPKILNVLFEGEETTDYDKDELLNDISGYVNENISDFTG